MKWFFGYFCILSWFTQANPSITIIRECDNYQDIFFFYENEFNKGITYAEILSNDSSLKFTSHLSIKTSAPLFIHFANESKFYPIYAEPGDTVIVHCTNVEDQWFLFSGTKSKFELNFIVGLEKNFGFTFPDYQGYFFTDRLNLEYFYSTTTEKYLAKKEYIISNGSSLSDRFTQALLNTIYYQYLNALLAPYFALSPELDLNKIPESYVHRVINFYNEFVSKPQDIQNKYYRFTLGSFVKFMNRDSYNIGYPPMDLLRFSYTEFDGVRREYLLFFFTKQNFETHKLVNEYLTRLSESSNGKYLIELKRMIDMHDHFFDDPEILNTKLKETNLGENVVSHFLSRHLGKVLYIDFWASWCGPCLKEMPNSKLLQERYKGRDVDFVFISIDSDPKKWMNALSRLPFSDLRAEHYLLGEETPFAVKLKLPPIPRYMLIDRDGTVVSLDAPRPGDPNLAEELERLLND